MSLLDEAVKLQSRPGPACAVHVLKEANPKLHAELMEALASSVQTTAVSRALKADHGILMAPDNLTRHKRGDCVQCRS
jgi:hypothetical protein